MLRMHFIGYGLQEKWVSTWKNYGGNESRGLNGVVLLVARATTSDLFNEARS